MPVLTTRPDFLPRHNISDEELSALVSTNRDGLSDKMWGFAGISAGLGPCLEPVWSAYIENPPIQIGMFHLGELVVFCLSAGIAGTIWFIGGKRENRATTLAEQIRARPVR